MQLLIGYYSTIAVEPVACYSVQFHRFLKKPRKKVFAPFWGMIQKLSKMSPKKSKQFYVFFRIEFANAV